VEKEFGLRWGVMYNGWCRMCEVSILDKSALIIV